MATYINYGEGDVGVPSYMPTKPKLFWDVLGRDSWISYRAGGFWQVGLFGEACDFSWLVRRDCTQG